MQLRLPQLTLDICIANATPSMSLSCWQYIMFSSWRFFCLHTITITNISTLQWTTKKNKAVIYCISMTADSAPSVATRRVTLSTHHFQVAIYAGTLCANMMSWTFNMPTVASKSRPLCLTSRPISVSPLVHNGYFYAPFIAQPSPSLHVDCASISWAATLSCLACAHVWCHPLKHTHTRTHARTHTHTHTRLTALFPGLPRCAGTRKVKPIWILLKQETVSGSGINWAICKSAPRSKQTTTPAPYHSVFTGRMLFLPPNQQRQSTVGISIVVCIPACHPLKQKYIIYYDADRRTIKPWP